MMMEASEGGWEFCFLSLTNEDDKGGDDDDCDGARKWRFMIMMENAVCRPRK